MNHRRASLPFILVALFIDALGIGLVIPVLPDLIKQFTSSASEKAYYYGFLQAIYAAMQFLFAPVLGALSDRYGRRPVLLVSLLGAGLDYFLFALSPSLVWLFVARAIAGLTGANFTVAYAYVADVSPPEKRAARFGLLAAAFGAGYVLGPSIGGTLGNISPHLPYYFAGGLALLNWLYGYFVLPESLPASARAKTPLDWRKLNAFSSLFELRRYPLVSGLVLAIVLTTLALGILQNTYVLYLGRRFTWTSQDIGFAIGALGVLIALVQVGFIRVLMKWLGERRTVLFGALAGVLGYVLLGLATQGWMIVPVGLALGLASVAEPAARGLLSSEVGEANQGSVMGSVNSLTSLIMAVSPVIGATVYAQVVSVARDSPLLGAPYYLSALLTLVGLALILWSFARHPHPQQVKSP